jgi:hypothetical protein
VSDVGRYRRAFPRLFRHPVFKQLSPLGQRLTVYILFGPQSNRIGLFYMSLNTAAEDLDTTTETLRKALADVLSGFGWSFDAVARVFYIPTHWRWNHPDHGKVLLGNLKDLSEIPPCGLVDAFAANTLYLAPKLHETFIEAIRIRLGEAPRSQYQYQDQEQKQEQEPRVPRKGGSEKEHDVSGRTNGTTNKRQAKLETLARKTLTFSDPHNDVETLLDSFYTVARSEGVHDCEKHDALAALNVALAEYRRGLS